MNTFSSGINTSFSTELNENFTEAEELRSLDFNDNILTEDFHYVDYSQSSGTVTLEAGKVYKFKSFNQTGGTLTVDGASDSPLVIIVDGNCVIDGTIDLSGLGYPATAQRYGDKSTGYTGGDWDVDYSTSGKGAGLGGVGGNKDTNVGGTGGAVQVYVAFSDVPSATNLFYRNNITAGAGGGSGGCGEEQEDISSPQYGSGGFGGAGGGALIIICKGNLTVSGTINLSGQNGGNGGANYGNHSGGGGGGAGAGGSCVLMRTGTYSETGTITLTGGTGGSGFGGGQGRGGGGGAGGSGPGANGTAGDTAGSNTGIGGDGGDGGDGAKYTYQI